MLIHEIKKLLYMRPFLKSLLYMRPFEKKLLLIYPPIHNTPPPHEYMSRL